MDITIIISVIVLAVITGAEFFCLFCCSKLRGKKRPVAVVVPVRAGDRDLHCILEYYAGMFERGSDAVDCLLLIDYGADEEQLSLCRDFCRTFGIAIQVKPEELEKKLSEIFAFSPEM